MSLRRRIRRMGAEDAEVNMTPMLDIVFIMLIFFIVTATFLDETGLDFTKRPSPMVEPELPLAPAIFVYLDADNRVSVDRELAELSAVPARVEALLAEKPDAAIMLNADAAANWDPVVFIKDEMAKAGRPVVITVTK